MFDKAVDKRRQARRSERPFASLCLSSLVYDFVKHTGPHGMRHASLAAKDQIRYKQKSLTTLPSLTM
jgi:hypothetical protein